LAAVVLPVLHTRAQTPEPVVVPAPPNPPDVAPEARTPETVKAYRYEFKLEMDEAAKQDSIRELAEDLRSQAEELRDEGEDARAERLERRAENLERSLERLRIGVHPHLLDFPDVDFQFPDIIQIPDIPKTVIDAEGRTHIIFVPRSQAWKHKRDEKVAIFSDVYVDSSEYVRKSAVAVMGNVTVDGQVGDAAVAVFGDVHVNGLVSGDAVAPFGVVYLSENAVVEGDVVAVDVEADDNAVIGGTIEETQLPRVAWMPQEYGVQSLYAFIVTIAFSIALLAVLLGLLALAVAPRNVHRIEERITIFPVRSFFWGLLFEVLAFPVALLLIVTVIGIPVAFLVLPVLLVTALVLGFAALARMFGSRLVSWTGAPTWGGLQFVVGALLFHAPLLVGLGLFTPIEGGANDMGFVATMLIFLGVALLYLVSTAGMGAALISRLGTRAPRPEARHYAASTPAGNMPPPPSTATAMPAPPGPSQTAT
jgi:cytoskeletal protein CcmA (bactofilin family)